MGDGCRDDVDACETSDAPLLCDSLDSLSSCSAASGASIASLSGISFVFLQVSVYADGISIFSSSNREILVVTTSSG